MDVAAGGEPHNVSPRCVVALLVVHGEVAVQDLVPEGDPEGRQQLVDRRDVGAAGDRRPPAPRVVVEEPHLDHGVNVVPLGEDHEPEPGAENIVPQLLNLLREVLLLEVHHQQRPVLAGVEAGERRAERLDVVAGVPQHVEHDVEVGVQVIAMPVQDVVPDVQGVPRDVPRRVLDVVELVPEEPPRPRRRRHHLELQAEHAGAAPAPTSRLLRRAVDLDRHVAFDDA